MCVDMYINQVYRQLEREKEIMKKIKKNKLQLPGPDPAEALVL